MSLFSLAANDQSVYYLGQLFGNVGSVLSTKDGSMLLGAMFKTLNTTALVIGGVLVAHTIVVGLLKTAAEGEFLGKQWSSLWVPFRMVLGIMALFPTITGYSAIQIVMMWIIIQGVGAADALWSTVLNYVAYAGSPYASVSMPPSNDTSQQVENLFKVLTCEASAVGKDMTSGQATGDVFADTYGASSGAQVPYYYCADKIMFKANSNFCSSLTPPFVMPADAATAKASGCMITPAYTTRNAVGKTVTNPSMITCPIGPSGACGSIAYANEADVCSGSGATGVQCAATKAQREALQSIVGALQMTAGQVVKYDHDYIAYTENSSPYPTSLIYTPNPTNASLNEYNWKVPSWIKTYCDSNSISPCCVYGSTASSTPVVAGGCPRLSADLLPYAQSNGIVDHGNPSDNVVDKILWPFGLQAVLVGATNPNGAAGVGGSPDFLAAATQYYADYLNAKNKEAMIGLVTNNATALSANSWQGQAQQLGWIMAGAYYYKIASSNANNLQQSIPPLAVTLNSPPLFGMANYRNNINAANEIITQIKKQSLGSSSLYANSPGLAQVGSNLNGFADAIVSSFMETISGAGREYGSTGAPGVVGQAVDPVAQPFMAAKMKAATNPLVALQSFGEKLLITGQVAFAVFLALAMFFLVIGNINAMGMGFGLTQAPADAMTNFLAYTSWALLLLFLGWLFTFGGILAVYTPLIPYVVFTMGAIGWFSATIEAMIAAPLIAIGILSPGGEHEILGRAAPSVLVISNVFLRPSLMIMGMMAAMLMVPVTITMINAGFKGVMGSIVADPGIAELIFFITAYVMLVVTVVSKCFALIHMIPSRVLTWIGGQAMSYGEEEGLREVKAGVDETISGVAQGAKDAIQGVREFAEEKKRGELRKQRQDAAIATADRATVNDPDASADDKEAASERIADRAADLEDQAIARDPKMSTSRRNAATQRIKDRADRRTANDKLRAERKANASKVEIKPDETGGAGGTGGDGGIQA